MIQTARILSFFFGAIFLSSAARVDLTLMRDAGGADVVRAVSTKMDDTNLFDVSSVGRRPAVELFMRESAYVESMDGTDFSSGVRDGGIWRIDRACLIESEITNIPSSLTKSAECFV